MDKEGVFRNESVLSPEFLPERLPGRENEISEIASFLAPACEGRRPRNLFIHGGTGTGKSSSTKYVMRQLEEAPGKAIPVYVNCWSDGTRAAVLSRVSHALQLPLPRRGLAGDEVFSRAVELLKAEKKIPVIFLDEVDSLSPGEEKVLYDLSRSGETFGAPMGVVCIANDRAFFANLDQRIRSSFAGTEIEFKQYSPPQLKQILGERAKVAFFAGACPEEVIALCAAHGAKMGGDARVAIETLWFAGRIAEKAGKTKLAVADARAAIDTATRTGAEKAAQTNRVQKISSLAEGERLIIDILAKGKELTSGDLYAEYVKKRPESERTIRNYLEKLESKKLIKVEDVGGSEGRTRKITLAH